MNARMQRPLSISIFLAVALSLSLLACDDDGPAGPRTDDDGGLWTEVDLGIVLSDTRLVAVDCADGDCLAMGYTSAALRRGEAPSSATLFYALQPGGSWEPTTLAGLDSGMHRALAMASGDKPVVVGFFASGASYTATIHDGRLDPAHAAQVPGGAFLCVDGNEQFFVAGGQAVGGPLSWSSTTPGSWVADAVPFSGRNDNGLWDVYVAGNMAVACGFDDGADTLQVVLRRTASSSWEMVNRNGLSGLVTLRSVGIRDGAIAVGGIHGAGGMNSRAFLAVRSLDGEWVEIVLPEPQDGPLGGVNDILFASDGSAYLACSGEEEFSSHASIVRATSGGIVRETDPFPGQLLGLAEGHDGSIYAVGSRRIGDGRVHEPVLLMRTP